MTHNVLLLCQMYGIERVGFLTLTFADQVVDPKEAYRRFRSLRTHVLDERYEQWVRVLERQKSGRIHYHLLVVLKGDIRTGVDFGAFGRGEYRSAGPELRSEWAFWRSTAPKFRFGRTELLPVKSTSQAIGRYVGKYIAKHIESRKEEDKGVRLVGYSAGCCRVRTRFAWNSPRAWLWRQKVASLAGDLGISDETGFRQRFGSKWAWKLSDAITRYDLADRPGGVRYPSVRHAKADGRVIEEDVEEGVGSGWIEVKRMNPTQRKKPMRVKERYDTKREAEARVVELTGMFGAKLRVLEIAWRGVAWWLSYSISGK